MFSFWQNSSKGMFFIDGLICVYFLALNQPPLDKFAHKARRAQ
jgi:hypothetical protein